MLVKVKSLAFAIELYHAGLLCWRDGEAWSLANHYAPPDKYDYHCAHIYLED